MQLPEATLPHLRGLDTLVVNALRYTPTSRHIANLEQALSLIAELEMPRSNPVPNMHSRRDYRNIAGELPDGSSPLSRWHGTVVLQHKARRNQCIFP